MKNPKSNTGQITYSAKEILKGVQQSIQTMKSNWDKIRNYNVLEKDMKPVFNIEAIYKENMELESKIVEYKLMSLALNLGYDNINQISKKSSFPTIYVLSQLKSRRDNLKTIRTNYNIKTEKISFNKKFISNELNKLDKEILRSEIELEKFNTNTKISA